MGKQKVFALFCTCLALALALTGCGVMASSATPEPAPADSASKKPDSGAALKSGTGAPAPISSPVAAKTPTPTPVKTPAATPVANPAPAPKSTPTPTPKPTPKTKPSLTQVAFKLALQGNQEYAEYTIPIYLTAEQTLHWDWLITDGGNIISVIFTTPGGKFMAIKANGNIDNFPAGSIQDKLGRMGSQVFRPSNYSLGDGYYIFHPNIRKGDADVSAKVMYWIEQ